MLRSTRFLLIEKKIKKTPKFLREVYEKFNNEFIYMSPFGPMNDRIFRAAFKERLENKIANSIVKCDEENNTPEVIDYCCLIAEVMWEENYRKKYYKLIFGEPEQIKNFCKLITNNPYTLPTILLQILSEI